VPTPSHNLRIPDEVWFPAVKRAEEQHENVTAVVVRGLRAYLDEPSWRERALAAEAELRRIKGEQ
jgi:hypothetical protein